jgi:hypothetical protein
MGMFGTITYPLKSTTSVSSFADSIMKSYSWDSLSSELKDVSKKSWSDNSLAIATSHAYKVSEGEIPNTNYVNEGKEIIRK